MNAIGYLKEWLWENMAKTLFNLSVLSQQWLCFDSKWWPQLQLHPLEQVVLVTDFFFVRNHYSL